MTVANTEIARQLDEIADLLDRQESNPFRVRAYRHAAQRVREIDQPLVALVQEQGPEALEDLTGIGESLAVIIAEIVQRGRSSLLDRLISTSDPRTLLQRVPGIGEELADRIVEQLGVTTLEALEQAAHDGRLAQVPGFGEERVRNVQVTLAGMLSGAALRRVREVKAEEPLGPPEPPVHLLLEIDALYREQAEAGQLRRIAPKRFNPTGAAWLPILNIDREGWQFTALYSNTARAHELDMTRDWVVIYYKQEGREKQVTVVTETHGRLKDKRVVRGREAASRRYYEEGQGDAH